MLEREEGNLIISDSVLRGAIKSDATEDEGHSSAAAAKLRRAAAAEQS